MKLLYQLVTGSYHLLLRGLSPVNQKARKWVDGRKDLLQQLAKVNISQPLIWFHCASLGEFEQGKPVMEAFKKRHPEWLLLVTFFSPSGYEARKDCELADYVMYLPKESSKNVTLFLDAFKPKLSVFIKYEFWYGYMQELYTRNIPLVFVSSSFRENQVFFKPYGGWFLKQLKSVQMYFVQDEKSKVLLESHGIKQVEVSGDTRFDRVLESKNVNEEILILKEFKGKSKVLIFGSAWQTETEYAKQILHQLPSDWKMIYAPHEIVDEEIERLRNDWNVNSVRFSEAQLSDVESAKVLVIDTIGHLARAYKYADVAFVGGGFIDGIHNILEPLTFGVPVFFGPNHKKFGEGFDSIQSGVGFEVSKFEDFESKMLEFIHSPEILESIHIKSESFVKERAGATKIVSEFLNKIGQIISCQI